jgi:tetratricopeptide (TPR) repeat protein
VPLIQSTDRAKAQRYLEDGLGHCDRALALRPNDADAMALKGSLQGLAIGFDPKSVQTLGLQARMNLHRAAALEPSNPRVWLLEGIQVLHTPAQFGGGPAQADTVFRQAIGLFAGAPADSTAPDWGRDDVYVWAGQCAARLEDWSRARDLYREALRLNPDNAWVRGVLLPEAEKALAQAPAQP